MSSSDIFVCHEGPFLQHLHTVGIMESPLFQSCSGIAVGSDEVKVGSEDFSS